MAREAEKVSETESYKRMSVEETLKKFQVDPKNGLSEKEVEEKVKKYGLNEIPEKEESLFHRIFRRFWGPIPWMIETAAILSAVVHKWEDFGIISALLVTNAVIDFLQERKALNTLKVLKKSLARKATVLREGKFQQIDAKRIVPGDIIKIKSGEIIPGDVKLVEGEYLQVDQSALTGESLPVAKRVNDIAYANSISRQGEMIAIVINTGLNTYFGKTVSLVVKAGKEQHSHFQKMIIKVGNYLIFFTLIMAVIILATALVRHENMLEIFRFTLVLIVAAIPVALPAVLTVTMAVGAMALAKKKAIVSRLAAIEELAGIDVLCSDKTGTLTQNRMTIAEPLTIGKYTSDELMLYAGLASKEENKDPIETPIFEYLKEHKLYDKSKKYKREGFKPFDPVSKRTEVAAIFSKEKYFITKGAPQVILKLCGKNVDSKAILTPVEEYARKGYRTLGVAIKSENEQNYNYVGLIPLFDPPRDDAKETLAEAQTLGLNVKMVTGDNVAIAKQIAAQLGLKTNILESDILKTGGPNEFVLLAKIISESIYKKLNPKITELQAEKFADAVTEEVKKQLDFGVLPDGYVKKHESEIVSLIENASGFAEVFPEDKYLIVDKLQKGNHITGMTGDGVNDAPALKKADAGIAVSGATDAARAAADLVLMLPGISVIIDAIKLARVTFERMKSYAIYRIAETIRVILFMTLAILVFNFYPLTAIMIILLALLNDIPILTISTDNTKIDPKPVHWSNAELLGLSTLIGTAGVISSFLIFFLLEEYFHLPQPAVQTGMFVKLIVAGHLTIYNTRRTDWFFKKPGPSSPLLWASFSTAVLGTVIGVFGIFVPPISWKLALILWGYAFVWFLFNDVVKVLFYRNLFEKNKIYSKHFQRHNKRVAGV